MNFSQSYSHLMIPLCAGWLGQDHKAPSVFEELFVPFNLQSLTRAPLLEGPHTQVLA